MQFLAAPSQHLYLTLHQRYGSPPRTVVEFQIQQDFRMPIEKIRVRAQVFGYVAISQRLRHGPLLPPPRHIRIRPSNT